MQTDEMKMTSEQPAASMLPPATGSSYMNVGLTERLVSVFVGAAASVYGFRNIRSAGGLLSALGGTFLVARGVSGYCPVNQYTGRNTAHKRASTMEVKEVFIVNKPRAEVYAYWRNFENLPRFMRHLEQVKEHDMLGHRTTWTAVVPGGLGTVSWDAEITEDIAGESLVWSSLPGSTIDNAGEVRFKDAADNAGTEVHACISYRLPAGALGSIAGKLFNPLVKTMIRQDLLRFKTLLESGDMATAKAPVKQGRKKKQSPSSISSEF